MGSLVSRVVDRRTMRWASTLVVAAVAGLSVATIVHRAEQVRASYGERHTVAVASSDLAVGREVTAGDVRWVERPTAVLAADPAPDPVGRVVTEPIASGEVVLERRLSGAGRSGPTALAPPGGRLLTVPADAPTPPVAVGDRVDVYAPLVVTGDASTSTFAGGARRVARDAVVAAVDEAGVTIAVTTAEAAPTARSVLDGAVVLVLAAPG